MSWVLDQIEEVDNTVEGNFAQAELQLMLSGYFDDSSDDQKKAYTSVGGLIGIRRLGDIEQHLALPVVVTANIER